MPYVVKSRRASTGQIVVSKTYDTKSEALQHARNTQTHWKHMFKNARVKKI